MKQLRHRQFVSVGFGLIVAAIVGVLASAIVTLPLETPGLADEVAGKLDQAGARNPVTAVLLNFRGYDTLLELSVLLLAVLGARVLATGDSREAAERTDRPINPVLLGFIRVVAPVMIVVAGYLLWAGEHAPGGAFQAGAVLAALGVLLHLGGVAWTQVLSPSSERLLLVAGLAVYLAVGVGTTISGARPLFAYAPSAAKSCMLLIEAVASVSIAATLLALFCSGTLGKADSTRVESEKGCG